MSDTKANHNHDAGPSVEAGEDDPFAALASVFDDIAPRRMPERAPELTAYEPEPALSPVDERVLLEERLAAVESAYPLRPREINLAPAVEAYAPFRPEAALRAPAVEIAPAWTGGQSAAVSYAAPQLEPAFEDASWADAQPARAVEDALSDDDAGESVNFEELAAALGSLEGDILSDEALLDEAATERWDEPEPDFTDAEAVVELPEQAVEQWVSNPIELPSVEQGAGQASASALQSAIDAMATDRPTEPIWEHAPLRGTLGADVEHWAGQQAVDADQTEFAPEQFEAVQSEELGENQSAASEPHDGASDAELDAVFADMFTDELAAADQIPANETADNDLTARVEELFRRPPESEFAPPMAVLEPLEGQAQPEADYGVAAAGVAAMGMAAAGLKLMRQGDEQAVAPAAALPRGAGPIPDEALTAGFGDIDQPYQDVPATAQFDVPEFSPVEPRIAAQPLDDAYGYSDGYGEIALAVSPLETAPAAYPHPSQSDARAYDDNNPLAEFDALFEDELLEREGNGAYGAAQSPAQADPLAQAVEPRDEFDDFGQVVAEEANPARGRRALMVAGVVVAVAVFGSLAALGNSVFGLFGGDDGPASAPQIVRADNEPVRVVPVDPGGTRVPNQDSVVMNEVAGGTAAEPAVQQPQLVEGREEPPFPVRR
ncbi:MAG: hypothetical protein HC779_08140 [Phyllobacteriaceae bacterium]|nr:hypothetical protein [Phyllobacteriaceae bacterium]